MGLLDSQMLIDLLGAGHRRHTLIANNLANIDTPGYKAARLRFTRQLEAVLDERGLVRPGTHIQTEVYHPMFADAGADGNDVTLAREMLELGKNTLQMKLYLAALGSRIQRLKTAIEGR